MKIKYNISRLWTFICDTEENTINGKKPEFGNAEQAAFQQYVTEHGLKGREMKAPQMFSLKTRENTPILYGGRIVYLEKVCLEKEEVTYTKNEKTKTVRLSTFWRKVPKRTWEELSK